jgi:ATP/maltotriose-dependent transcriptional regulator MalT/DNA-binding SARP family transcriptional activator
MRRGVIPKVVPPRLARVAARPRISKLVIERAGHAAVWMQAPGGTGKTTALALVGAELQRPIVWLHIDPGDDEPGTFFHYLGLAVSRAMPRAGAKVPAFSAASKSEAEFFARTFARAALAASPKSGAILVLDNLQDIPEESPTHGLVATLCKELTPSWAVLIASRHVPGKPYSRLLGEGRLAIVPAQEFAFTRDELKAALRERGILEEARLHQLWTQSGGWISAALLLAMQPASEPRGAMAPDDPTLLFDYFATQVLDDLDEEDRRLVTRTAFLSTVSPEAAAGLAQLPDAGRRLERLVADGLFVTRLGSSPARYRYHDLFRDFLLTRARKSLTPDEIAALRCDSATQLLAEREPLAALELLCDGREWDRLEAAAVEWASLLVEQGHFRALGNVLERLPAERLDRNPWLLYWLGQCELHWSDDRARTRLGLAYDRFEACGSRIGQLLAAIDLPAIAFNQGKSYDDFHLWIRRMEELASSVEEVSSPALALKVLAGLVAAMVRSPRLAARADEIAHRIMEQLPRVESPNLRLVALSRLAFLAWRQRRPEFGPPAIAMVAEQSLESRASPLLVLHWLYDAITYDSIFGDPERALRNARRAEEIAQSVGSGIAQFEATLLHLEIACDMNDPELARRLWKRLGELNDPSRPMNRLGVTGFAARIALLEGDGTAAVERAAAYLAVADELHFPEERRISFAMVELGALTLQRRYDDALARAAHYRSVLFPHDARYLETTTAWIRAAAAIDAGSADARSALTEAVAMASASRDFHPLRHTSAVVARLCLQALEWDIENEYVKALIARRRLEPPDPDSFTWPWRIRVRTLGTFSIEIDGVEVSGASRSPKVLELLQVAIALGGEQVPLDRIVKVVWPGEGREGVQQAFDTTLHRLRKVLGSESAVGVADRRLTINRREVWVDALALEHRLSVLDAGGPAPDRKALAEMVSLYRGHFLHQMDASWKRVMHERLWGGLRRVLIAGAKRAQAAGDFEDAERILYFIVDRDPLAEDAYAAILRMHLDRGRPAEALRAYRRCAAALEDELGVEPGRELQALASEVEAKPAASPARKSRKV